MASSGRGCRRLPRRILPFAGFAALTVAYITAYEGARASGMGLEDPSCLARLGEYQFGDPLGRPIPAGTRHALYCRIFAPLIFAGRHGPIPQMPARRELTFHVVVLGRDRVELGGPGGRALTEAERRRLERWWEATDPLSFPPPDVDVRPELSTGKGGVKHVEAPLPIQFSASRDGRTLEFTYGTRTWSRQEDRDRVEAAILAMGEGLGGREDCARRRGVWINPGRG